MRHAIIVLLLTLTAAACRTPTMPTIPTLYTCFTMPRWYMAADGSGRHLEIDYYVQGTPCPAVRID